jgi:antitoxin MazE
MQARIQKWGNSLAVRIPKTLATEAHLAQEAVVDLAVEKGKLIIAPIKRQKYKLEGLVSKITDPPRIYSRARRCCLDDVWPSGRT